MLVFTLGRKKKVDPLEKFITFLRKKANEASIRDLAYLASYTGCVFLAYELIEGISLEAVISKPSFWEAVWSLKIFPRGFQITTSKEVNEDKEFNPKSLAKALVVAHMVLRIDVADVASAIGKLSTTVISGLVASTPLP